MNLQQFNPWNWFKHEEPQVRQEGNIPVRQDNSGNAVPHTGAELTNPFYQLQRNVDRLFEETMRGLGFNGGTQGNWSGLNAFKPGLDISSSEDHYEINLEVPGIKESDLSVEVKDDVLIIKGEKQEEKEDKDRYYYRIERNFGTFQRVLSLPHDADPEAIKANLRDGVLSLHIPRLESERGNSKKITITH